MVGDTEQSPLEFTTIFVSLHMRWTLLRTSVMQEMRRATNSDCHHLIYVDDGKICPSRVVVRQTASAALLTSLTLDCHAGREGDAVPGPQLHPSLVPEL